jgi:amidase
VQLIGPPFREDVVIAAAQAVQDARAVLTPVTPRSG